MCRVILPKAKCLQISFRMRRPEYNSYQLEIYRRVGGRFGRAAAPLPVLTLSTGFSFKMRTPGLQPCLTPGQASAHERTFARHVPCGKMTRHSNDSHLSVESFCPQRQVSKCPKYVLPYCGLQGPAPGGHQASAYTEGHLDTCLFWQNDSDTEVTVI